MSSAQTEEERMKAMFNLRADQWQQQQQEMANATPAFHGRPTKGKPINVPEGEPPHGYRCHRCHKTGHWIQACPTNDDPEYDSRPRIKRTTGIPRSFLKTVAQPEAFDGSSDNSKRLMLNADGEFVVAETDQKAWKQWQEKAKASAAAQQAAAAGSKELQDLGIECSIDMKMFVDPMKTPCCGRTYCNDCITNALGETDLVCPGCGTENVLIENLVPDKEVQEKIKAYKTEKADKVQGKEEGAKSPEASVGAKSPAEDESAKSPGGKKPRSNSPSSAAGDAAANSKKRPADNDKSNEQSNSEEAPAMKKQRSQEQNGTSAPSSTPSLSSIPGLPADFFNPSMPLNSFNGMAQPGFPPMPAFPGQMPFMGMPPNMGMMNPMMMPPGPNFMGNGMNGLNMNGMNPMGGMMNGMNFPNQPNGMFPPNFNNGMNGSGFGGGQNNNNFTGVPTGPAAMNQNRGPQMQQAQQGQTFSNQQRNAAFGKDEDNAYMRQPINPHRHQARQRRVRPSDYREL